MDVLATIDRILCNRYTSVLLLLFSILLSLVSYQQHLELIALAEFLNFAVEHKCEIVSTEEGKSSSSFGYLISPTGKFMTGSFITTEPDSVCYRCDDGVVYCR